MVHSLNTAHLVWALRIWNILYLGWLITEFRQKLCHLAYSPSTLNTCLAYSASTPNEVHFKSLQKTSPVFFYSVSVHLIPNLKFLIGVPLKWWEFFEVWLPSGVLGENTEWRLAYSASTVNENERTQLLRATKFGVLAEYAQFTVIYRNWTYNKDTVLYVCVTNVFIFRTEWSYKYL